MKKVYLSLILCFYFIGTLSSQTLPSGMKYQAVARTPSGKILADQQISLKINLYSSGNANSSHYTEVHNTKTNQLGLFTLVIGEGIVDNGSFATIPWDKDEIWMEIAIKDKNHSQFTSISTSKLLAVPYAFHAGTAAALSKPTATATATALRENDDQLNKDDKCYTKGGITLLRLLYLGDNGVQINVYEDKNLKKLLKYFSGVNNGDIIVLDARLFSPSDKKLKNETYLQIAGSTLPPTILPTQGDQQIVSSTYNNFSVLSVLAYNENKNDNPVECSVCDVRQDWKIGGNVVSELCNRLGTKNPSDVVIITNNIERARIFTNGDVNVKNSVDIDKNLNVDGEVTLNTSNGNTINNGELTVQKATLLNNSLTVMQSSVLNGTLQVQNGMATTLSGSLQVLKNGLFNEKVLLDNATHGSTTPQTGALVVNGGVGIGENINIGGDADFGGNASFSGNLFISNNTSSTSTTTGALVVSGGVGIGENLNIGGNTKLDGTLDVQQATALAQTLDVTGATTLNNDLTVMQASILNGELSVQNAMPTTLTGILDVNQNATFNQQVLIDNIALGATSSQTGALVVRGGAGIGENLFIAGNTHVGGNSDLSGKLNITNTSASSSYNTGAAVIAGGMGIGKELYVQGQTQLNNTLNVSGTTTMNQTLNVIGATILANTLNVSQATSLGNSLNVAGPAVMQNTLAVDNVATFNANVILNSSLETKNIKVSTSSTDFIAEFENTDGTNGDGLKIKLGKTNPMWKGSWVSTPNIAADAFQQPINTIRGWVIDHNAFQASDLITLFPSSLIAGTVVNVVNTVTGKINDALNLPLKIGPYGIPALDIVPEIDGVGGPWGLPATNILPEVTIFPAIPAIPNVSLPSLSIPNLAFTDVSNSLTNENEFISFVDKDNRQLGTIRAQSINDFSANYLDGVYFVNLMASLVGIDIVGGIAGGIAEFTNLADAYNKIGVEYSSGHGDYAEWLERENPFEVITAGDIVAVKGGKITRKLENAEQVMVASYKPIILGNTPPEGQEFMGNKIAFMGQVPVKVMGPVNAGDYIVGIMNMAGYGVAVHPNNMSVQDYKYSVGRSWENNLKEGPKMINTIIGIDNGAYLNILKKNEHKVQKIEKRLNNLELKLLPLFNSQTSFKGTNSKK